MPPALRARDAFGAARYLRKQPGVQADRIAVVGFSHGGSTAMRAAQANTNANLDIAPFVAAVAYYPGCNTPAQRDVGVPTLVLIGELDDWTPTRR